MSRVLLALLLSATAARSLGLDPNLVSLMVDDRRPVPHAMREVDMCEGSLEGDLPPERDCRIEAEAPASPVLRSTEGLVRHEVRHAVAVPAGIWAGLLPWPEGLVRQ